jgi:hypothetical protein
MAAARASVDGASFYITVSVGVERKLHVPDADANNAGTVTLNVFKPDIVISATDITTPFRRRKR